jgi:hypothetical protein
MRRVCSAKAGFDVWGQLVPGGEHALVAIDLHTMRDPSMTNTIASFYGLDAPSFESRVKSGKLRPIPHLGVDKFT